MKKWTQVWFLVCLSVFNVCQVYINHMLSKENEILSDRLDLVVSAILNATQGAETGSCQLSA